MMKKERQVHTAQFKHDALNLWQTTDRSARQVEKELGLTAGILYKWKKQLERDGEEAFPGQGRLKPSDERVRQLERELAIVKQERDILKKTVGIFSSPSKNGFR